MGRWRGLLEVPYLRMKGYGVGLIRRRVREARSWVGRGESVPVAF